ncbi:MAG: hypothetical protein AAB408_01770 [Patescibacteria group bacterium]
MVAIARTVVNFEPLALPGDEGHIRVAATLVKRVFDLRCQPGDLAAAFAAVQREDRELVRKVMVAIIKQFPKRESLIAELVRHVEGVAMENGWRIS